MALAGDRFMWLQNYQLYKFCQIGIAKLPKTDNK
jgi:hypothetical protein